MDAQPFRSMSSFLNATPLQRWGAVVCSLASVVLLLLLTPILYLVADLLVNQGHIPDWGGLKPHTRHAFHEEWDRKLKDDEAIKTTMEKLDTGRTGNDYYAWWATNDVALKKNVSEAAAETYLTNGNHGIVCPTNEPVGILATVARLRGHTSASVIGWFASWNRWTWNNESYLLGLFILAALLIGLRGLFLNLSAMFACSACVDASVRLRRNVYNHSLRLGALAVNPAAQIEAGDIMTRRIEQLWEGFLLQLTTGIRAPVLVFLGVVLLLAFNLWFGLASLFLAGAVWLLAGQTAAWFRRDARHASRRSESRLAVLRENMNLMHMVKSFLMERFNQTRVERHLTDLAKAARRRLRGEVISQPTLYTIATLTGLVLTYLAARVVLGGGLSLAAVVTQSVLLAVVCVALHHWINVHVRMRRAKEAAANIAEFLDRRADAAQPIDAEFLKPMTRKLEIVELSYREPGTGRMLLDSVSMNIPIGTRVAVVCSTNTEAKTLAHLLTRFVEPTGGEIRMDGKNTRWVTFESLRTQMGQVLQENLTFSDTVANNIGCGDPSFTLPQIIEAAKLAHAHQFIQRLPYGYETPLGDNGHALRPGELYRIALARVLLRDPSLLILEEPAEPLDSDSLALIDDALTRYQTGHAILILARRSSTVKSADRVYVIQQGKVVASGNQDQLHAGSEVHKALTSRTG